MTDLRAAENVDQGQWWVDGLDKFHTVCGIVPRGYEYYARVLHPAWQHSLEDCHVVRKPVTWAEVASKRGRVAHRLMQWPQVSGSPRIDDPVIDRLAQAGCVILSAPNEGTIPLAIAPALREILLSHTEEPNSCWFGIWSGFGETHRLGLGKPKAIGNNSNDEWYLFRGSLKNIEYSFSSTGHQSANLVWAKDRSWCLGTNIDLKSTYIGGSKSLVSDVVKSSGLEAYIVYPADNVTYHADIVNPPEPYRNDMVVVRSG